MTNKEFLQKLRADVQAQYIAELKAENKVMEYGCIKYQCTLDEEDFLLVEKLKNRNITFCTREGHETILTPDQVHKLIIDLQDMFKEETK